MTCELYSRLSLSHQPWWVLQDHEISFWYNFWIEVLKFGAVPVSLLWMVHPEWVRLCRFFWQWNFRACFLVYVQLHWTKTHICISMANDVNVWQCVKQHQQTPIKRNQHKATGASQMCCWWTCALALVRSSLIWILFWCTQKSHSLSVKVNLHLSFMFKEDRTFQIANSGNPFINHNTPKTQQRISCCSVRLYSHNFWYHIHPNNNPCFETL